MVKRNEDDLDEDLSYSERLGIGFSILDGTAFEDALEEDSNGSDYYNEDNQ